MQCLKRQKKELLKKISRSATDFSDSLSKVLKLKDKAVFFFDINTLEEPSTLNEIIEEILKINEQYQCACLYNTLIVFLNHTKITISPLVRAITISSLYDGHNYLIDDVLKAELCIAKAKAEEKDALEELGEDWLERCNDTAGLSGHHALWAGLINLENEKYPKAKEYLIEARKRGLNHWRIDWYIAMAETQIFFDIA